MHKDGGVCGLVLLLRWAAGRGVPGVVFSPDLSGAKTLHRSVPFKHVCCAFLKEGKPLMQTRLASPFASQETAHLNTKAIVCIYIYPGKAP